MSALMVRMIISLVSDLNNQILCHLVNYAFAGLKNNAISLLDPNVDEDLKMISRVVSLRKHNSHLTVMISLGGWSEGSTKYSEMVRSESHRKHFVESVVKFLQKYDLDGVDLDWYAKSVKSIRQTDKTSCIPSGSTQASLALAMVTDSMVAPRTNMITSLF